MPTRVYFHLKPGSFKGSLMKFATGCYAYHCGFLVAGQYDTAYDMHFMRRKVPWSEIVGTHPNTIFEVYDLPEGLEVPEEYLIEKKLNDITIYGFKDYLAFAFRWVYHLMGKSTPNYGGLICSEMVYEDMKACGWKYAAFMEVPSPCCLRGAFRNLGIEPDLVYGENVNEENYRS